FWQPFGTGNLLLSPLFQKKGGPISLIWTDVLSGLLSTSVSLYVDDVIMFLHPKESDIQLVLKIIEIFGEASGLKTNIQKSCKRIPIAPRLLLA
ncbi:hypothetical protein ACJX0J_037752, partial [Zea mays]